jgi:hypothetical protein
MKRNESSDRAAREMMNRLVASARTHFHEMLIQRAIVEAACDPPIYRCVSCHENFVNPHEGMDTCPECVSKR